MPPDFEHASPPVPVDGQQFPCARCGGTLVFAPGTDRLTCRYCGHENRIVTASRAELREVDYLSALRDARESALVATRQTVKCTSCAAAFTFDPAVHADSCPFCGSDIVSETSATRAFVPNGVVPFKIDEQDAKARLKNWLGNLWFAPNAVVEYASQNGKLAGIYIPFWTYDAQTDSRYHGQRGDAYYVTVTRTVMVDGKPRRVSQRVRKIRWTSVAGRVRRAFDDVLVVASRTLPRRFAEDLAPWGLAAAEPYTPAFLSGFQAETYQVALDEGFEDAQHQMAAVIRHDVRRDIGGDEQRIHAVDTDYSDVTFKQLLLPIWTAAYRYRGKPYRFVVNGVTGEVTGERPYSWLKIGAAVGIGLLIGLALLYAMSQSDDFGFAPGGFSPVWEGYRGNGRFGFD